MYAIIQLITVLGVVLATFAIYSAIGKKKSPFIYSSEEKLEWDKFITKDIGSWFTITSIIGTLTTMATVFVFFIGNTSLFGWVIFVCVFSIMFSFLVTNKFTKKIVSLDYFKKRQKDNNNNSAVIASIFWANDKDSKRSSNIIKNISLINIAAIIWLEFSIFSDISGKLIANGNIYFSCLILFLITFLISMFTLKYGLRGFVVGDLLHSPLIIIGAIILLIGGVMLITNNEVPHNWANIKIALTPKLDWKTSAAFILATIFLNLFIVLVSEAHWLRVWIFGEKETKLQPKAQIGTAIIWFFIILIGIIVGLLGINGIGKDGVVELIEKLTTISPLFLVGFWIAGTAALFSTTDTQFYSLFLVKSFNPKTGKINTEKLNSLNPFFLSLIISIIFCVLYFLVITLKLPFEKLVFLLLPICMIIVPAFFRIFKGLAQKPIYLYLAILLYSLASIKALIDPDNEFFFTVAAPLMPLLVSVIAIMFHRNEKLSYE